MGTMNQAPQSPSSAPFGLAPNVAAALAYVFGIPGGIVMLVAGGSDKTVKWAAAQSIVMWTIYAVLALGIPAISIATRLSMIGFLAGLAGAIWFLLWVWTSITAYRGIELRMPVISSIAEILFKPVLG
jgi:uncharacterized membrane protein